MTNIPTLRRTDNSQPATETLEDCTAWHIDEISIGLMVKKCGDYWPNNWELCCKPSGKESKS